MNYIVNEMPNSQQYFCGLRFEQQPKVTTKYFVIYTVNNITNINIFCSLLFKKQNKTKIIYFEIYDVNNTTDSKNTFCDLHCEQYS